MYRISLRAVLPAVLALFCSANSFADVINASGGNFYTWTAGDVNNNGNPFWDQLSADGTQCNIGYWMLGTATPGACVNSGPSSAISPQGNKDFLGGAASTSNVAGFTFTPSGGPLQITLQVEDSGVSSSNTFGWYLVSSPGTLHQLFAGSDSPLLTTSFTPTGNYGFYLKRGDGTTFLTGGVSGIDGIQHLALFANSPAHPTGDGSTVNDYFIAGEDRLFGENSDFDFNDLVVHVTDVPEPRFLGILGLSAIGLMAAYLRRRNTVA